MNPTQEHPPPAGGVRRALTVAVAGGLVAWSALAPTLVSAGTSSTTSPPTTAETSTTTTTTTLVPTTTTSTSTTLVPTTTTTTRPSPPPATTTTTVAATTTTRPIDRTRCAPPTTTTTTTTTTTLVPTTTTTTTTTTTLVPTTTTTTTTLPPCPTTTVPTVPSGPPPPPPIADAALGISAPQHLTDILLTIRIVESGERYAVPPNRGGASGAYQYIDSTWNNYAGYPKAYLAPPHVQDERALADVQAILARWHGDVSMVPVIWYYPAAATSIELLDQVPLPSAGNRLTVREYQKRWLDVLAYITGNPSYFRPHALPPNLEFLSGRPPDLNVAADGDAALFDSDEAAQAPQAPIAFPVLGHTVITPPLPCGYDTCPAGTSAVVFGQKFQPILAVVDGVVTSVETSDPITGNVSLTITGRDGRRFVYSGLNDDNPGTNDGAAADGLRVSTLGEVGSPVYAGQIVGFMGDSDPMPGHAVVQEDVAVWPHLRLTGYDAAGVPLDTDLLVLQAQTRQACHVGIGPWSVLPDRDGTEGRVDVDVDAILYGAWTLHADGRVTAEGRSALIMPPEDCVWAPTDRFGPGAAGTNPPALWGLPFGIPSRLWAADALDRTALDAVTPSLLG